jgi:hypothetical protein
MRCFKSASTSFAWAHRLCGWLCSSIVFVWGCLLFVPKVAGGEPDHDGIDFFERKIRPVLIERCYTCHSAKAKKVRGGLLLDTRDGLRKGGSQGPAIVPGDPDASLLVRVIRYEDKDLQMPPKKRLSAEQVADFAAWIKRGAPDPRTKDGAAASASASRPAKEHWAFKTPPDQPPPQVKQTDWPKNALDHFILAKLEAQGMKPAPPAHKRTLLRRASFDLIGLPPTPQEVDAFLADDRPDAFARLVDRLLDSPRYGERWGRHWLDVARYADNKGHIDFEEIRFVHSWAYRDWVIRAFNEDLPYDQFIVQQLAADQVAPKDDPRPLAAMGFLTVGRRFNGFVPEMIADRIDVMGRGLLGLSLGCARCHDHKYDPIPTKDYYSLYGVFAGCRERVVPLVRDCDRTPEYAAYEKEMAKREQKFQHALKAALDRVADGARKITDQYLVAQLEMDKLLPEEVYIDFEEDQFNNVVARYWEAYLQRVANDIHPVFGPWNAYAALPAHGFRTRAPQVLPNLLAQASRVSVSAWPRWNARVLSLFATPPVSMREVAERYGKLLNSIDQKWRKALERAAKEKAAAPKSLDDPDEEELRQVLYGEDSPLNFPIHSWADIGFLFFEDVATRLGQLQKEIDQLRIASDAVPPYACILVDRPVQRNPRVFKRGNPETKGEKVPRQFLALLAGPNRKPFRHGSGRLELARAIASPDNPLTARVLVNRVWMHHFGQGIVRTPSDFGLRSEPPSHPELLDWLSRRFIEGGWSIKKLHRLIMLSSTYQQSSRDVPANRQIDPLNRLLWRMNVRRLEFEEMHDALLAVAGRLDTTMGGPPVHLEYEPFTGRRAVYAFIDRTHPPSLFATFDFANPDTHSPERYSTIVPQQALYLLNGRFADVQARHLAARYAAKADSARRIGQMYRLVFGRVPTRAEVNLGLDFLKNAAPPQPHLATPADAWKYGYGNYNPATGKVNFTPLPYFTGKAWQLSAREPHPDKGSAFLNAKGGHPGKGSRYGVIRRWVAPQDGTAGIRGTLSHQQGQGHGVSAQLVSSRHGVLATWTARKWKAETSLSGLEMKRGDALDFLVDGLNDMWDGSFNWAPVIELAPADQKNGTASGQTGHWDAAANFSGPALRQPTAWEKYAHVLLMSNEFMFVR